MSKIKVNRLENTATADGGIDIDSSGNVGVGDSSPNGNYGTNLSVHSTATNGARLKISDGTTGKGNTDGLDIISTGGIAYFIQRENAAMSFSTNATERMRILSSGGLTFNGDTAAANALDEYEEGTWTPGIKNNGDASGVAYSAQQGVYTRVGKLVTCIAYLALTNNGSVSGSVALSGLPFTVANDLGSTSLEGGGQFTYQNNTSGTIYGSLKLICENSTTQAFFYHASSTAGAFSATQSANIANNFDGRLIVHYFAA